MIKGSSGAKKRRDNGRHNPLGADIEADQMRGVRLKRASKTARDESDSDDDREVCLMRVLCQLIQLPHAIELGKLPFSVPDSFQSHFLTCLMCVSAEICAKRSE